MTNQKNRLYSLATVYTSNNQIAHFMPQYALIEIQLYKRNRLFETEFFRNRYLQDYLNQLALCKSPCFIKLKVVSSCNKNRNFQMESLIFLEKNNWFCLLCKNTELSV